MRILIHGDDSFRNLVVYQEIINQFKQKHDPAGKNIYLFSAINELSAVFNLIGQTSLFSNKQLIVVNDCHNLKTADLEKIININNCQSDNTTIVYRADKELSGKTKIEQELLRAEKNYFQPLLSGSRLAKWVSDLAKKNDLILNSTTINKIINITTNTWTINNLIKQLAAHNQADKQQDKNELIKLLTISKDETPIFALTAALAAGQKKQALGILHQHLNNGAEPIMVLGLLAKHLRDLTAAKNGLRDCFKSDYVFKKVCLVANNFSQQQLSNWQQNVILTDIAIKKGQPALVAINNLVLKIANFIK
jgi:DNA polymerase III delta subunit